MATPEWFAKLKRRTAEIIDFENDALERDMVRTQETPSETHETEEDIARRVRLERERPGGRGNRRPSARVEQPQREQGFARRVLRAVRGPSA